jgi:hypothetical protein
MIEISLTEFVLFCWAFLATVFWWDTHQHRKFERRMTMNIFHDLVKGNAKLIETDDGFEIKPVRNV